MKYAVILLLFSIFLFGVGLNDKSTTPMKQHFLLIYTPVTNEVLGTLEYREGKIVLVDCLGKIHDVYGYEIQSTQDTCVR